MISTVRVGKLHTAERSEKSHKSERPQRVPEFSGLNKSQANGERKSQLSFDIEERRIGRHSLLYLLGTTRLSEGRRPIVLEGIKFRLYCTECKVQQSTGNTERCRGESGGNTRLCSNWKLFPCVVRTQLGYLLSCHVHAQRQEFGRSGAPSNCCKSAWACVLLMDPVLTKVQEGWFCAGLTRKGLKTMMGMNYFHLERSLK